MALLTGVQHLYTFNIVASLIYHLLLNVGRRHKPSALPSLLMFRIDRPIALISSSQWFFHFGEVDSGGPVVIILASGSKVRGFDPGRGRWIFPERKTPEYDFLRKGSKAVDPVS